MNIVVIPGTNYNDAPAGFDAAVKYVTNLYDNLFSANVTVYINVDYGIVDNGLGESYWNQYDDSYDLVRQALINMGAPGSNTIPTTSPFPDATLWLTTAQEKALGFIPADAVPGDGYNFPGVDGNVVIASNQNWSFDPTATPAANQFDIVGALEHEFSEVLGRVSYDGTIPVNDAPAYSIMDLFRYSSPGVHQLSATSSPAYFSTDNGNSVYYYWNTHDNGFDLDGDLGDWWSSGPSNLDPTGPDAFLDISNPGQINGLSSVDLTLMQTIGWRETPVTPLNHAPVVTAPDFTASHNQNIAASALFSVTDADNDTITKYEFMDSTADPASGHWVVNGVAQAAQQVIDVSAAQLAQTTFQSGSGSADLWVRANDGTDWSAWTEFHVNAPINQPPVVTALDFTAHHNQNIAASALFSVTDADNDTITKYEFMDSTADPASGHWVVNGVAQAAQQVIDVSAAQLAQTTFQSGSGSADLWVRANDGTDWSAWTEFHVNAPLKHQHNISGASAPWANDGTDWSAWTEFHVNAPLYHQHNKNSAASALSSASDPGSDTITMHGLGDSTPDPSSGHWMVNGGAQGAQQVIDVSASQLAQTTHDSTASRNQNIAASALLSASDARNDPITKHGLGDFTPDPSSGHWVNGGAQGAQQSAVQLAQTTFQSGSGSDEMWVRANDGNVNAPSDQKPVVSGGGASISHPEKDPIVQYEFWDSNAAAPSGHFTINGTSQAAGQTLDMLAAQLNQASLVANSAAGVDHIGRAFDGSLWSDWHSLHVTSHA